jgi:hypothetical protein
MKKIILDNTFWAKLGNLKESAELCDEAGNILGRFTPLSKRGDSKEPVQVCDEAGNVIATLLSEPRFNEEELLKIEEESEVSTAEMLAQLEKL